jgi:hypothetical protein
MLAENIGSRSWCANECAMLVGFARSSRDVMPIRKAGEGPDVTGVEQQKNEQHSSVDMTLCAEFLTVQRELLASFLVRCLRKSLRFTMQIQ